MTQYTDPGFVPRPTCYRCFRPELLCYCAELRLVDNKTRVIVVQHPREQFHPLNTARIAENSLRASVVIRQHPSGVGAALKRAQVGEDAALLFPSDDAEQLETLAPEKRPTEIIVVDGTWSNAKTLLRDVPELRRYRRIKFTPSKPSSYRIRKEPRADYLSTIESVAYVLRYLEPDTKGIDDLEETFSKMIDRNIEARRPSECGARFQRTERNAPHQFPAELSSNSGEMVVAYCEGASRFIEEAEPFDAAVESRFAREPLVVYLKRLSDDAILKVLLRTTRRPSERLLAHLAILPHELEEHGVSKPEGFRQIFSWLRDGEMLVAWNPSTLRILRELGAEVQRHLLLKGVFCDYFTYLDRRASEATSERSAWGGMEEFLKESAIAAPMPQAQGRGALRLAQTEALLRWILPHARGDCGPSGSC